MSFPENYHHSRARFIGAVQSRGGTLIKYAGFSRGSGGDDLTIDIGIIGPEDASHALVLSSGVHGIEGFLGAAIQVAILDHIETLHDQVFVMIHAVNPWGFANHRRVNEDNVDIERNYIDFAKPRPDNPGYAALADAINPADLTPANETERWGQLNAYAAKHGERALHAAVAQGQYDFPNGLFFGGDKAAASRLALEHFAEKFLSGRKTMWLDVHTGLGAPAAMELIAECEPQALSYRRARRVFGDRVCSTRTGESGSPPLSGNTEAAMTQILGPDRLIYLQPEFGTLGDANAVFRALRMDGLFHRNPEAIDLDAAVVRNAMLEAFAPQDPQWRRAALATGVALFEEAGSHLAAPTTWAD